MSSSKPSPGEIFIVDDDVSVRETLKIVLGSAGYDVVAFADGPALLSVAKKRTPVCIILDVNIPGPSGLDVLAELQADDYPAPIFMISGQGDIPTAVDAIRKGALDFIEKPFRGSDLLVRLQESIKAFDQRQNDFDRDNVFHFPGKEPLTRREREALVFFAQGTSNKETAKALGLSPRTVETHRANIMKKLGAKNAADLVRIVLSSKN